MQFVFKYINISDMQISWILPNIKIDVLYFTGIQLINILSADIYIIYIRLYIDCIRCYTATPHSRWLHSVQRAKTCISQ
jgi:hypothetical protein